MSAFTALSVAGYRAYVRDKVSIFFTFIFPLIFLALFGLVFGKTVDQSGKPAIDSIAPGILSWGVGNAAVFSVGFTLMQWRRDDILRLMRMTPVSPLAVLGSRYVQALAVAVAQAVIFVAVASLPVFGLTLSGSWPFAVPVLVLGMTTFLAVGAIIGTYARTPESVAAIANCVMIPMAFLSGSFIPLSLMPHWVDVLAHVFPLYYLSHGLSSALAGDGSDIGTCCAVLVGWAVVLWAVALKIFRWSDRS